MRKETLAAVIGIALLCGALTLCRGEATEPECVDVDFGRKHWDGEQFVYVPKTRCIAHGRHVK